MSQERADLALEKLKREMATLSNEKYYWILEDGKPKAVAWDEWAVWFEKADKDGTRFLHKTEIELASGVKLEVSTVFLGLDHNFRNSGNPHIIETAALKRDPFECVVLWRCFDLEQAKHQHQRAIDAITDADHVERERVAGLIE